MNTNITSFDSSLNTKTLRLTSKLIFLAGIAWGMMYLYFEIYHAAYFPFLYSSLMGIVILLHEFGKVSEKVLLNSNLFLILVIPAMLQVSVGTYSNSGVVVLWSTFAPTGSLLFQGLKRAIFWFLAFIVVVFLLAAYEAFWLDNPSQIDLSTVIVFSLMNISAVTTVLFLSLRFYVAQVIVKQGEINKLLKDESEAKQLLNEKADSLNELLDEKNIMLKEIHHRVKNNLQVITSLLSLQNSFINNQEIKSIFQKSQNRINSMAMIHEMLYQYDQLNKIDFGKYADALIQSIIKSMSVDSDKIKFAINSPDIFLNLDTAIPLALIVNEVTTNALKYGINGMQGGEILLDLEGIENNQYKMLIGDNGIGIDKAKFESNKNTLGMLLIQKLIRQIDGKVELMDSSVGTYFKIDFQEV
jgi:two-component sensor histidine kinase